MEYVPKNALKDRQYVSFDPKVALGWSVEFLGSRLGADLLGLLLVPEVERL